MKHPPTHSRALLGTLAAFAAVVAVAAADGPAPAIPPSSPTRTAVVVSPGGATVPGGVPAAAEVRRVSGPYEASAAVLALVAHGYGTIVGLGPEARAAVEQARDGGVAAPGVRLLGR